jgi:murein DD-endopeptidase MepM/ murein hydrolase activator NlpD
MTAGEAFVMARVRSGLPFRALVGLLALLVAFSVPVAAPPGVEAGLSDAIDAARKRHKEIQASIDRQKGLVADLARDQDATRRAISDTDASLSEINTDQRKVRERIARAEAALKRVEARHAALMAELAELDWTIGLLEQELTSGQQDLEVRRQSLGQRLAEAYRTQNTSLLEQVLTAESFTDVVSDTSAYLAYGDQDARLAAEIASDQTALDSLRLLTSATRVRTDQLRRAAVDSANEITARKADLARERASLKRLESRTQRLKARQEAAFRRIAANKQQAARLLRQQAAAERQMERRIAGLVRAAQRRASARAGRDRPGGWSWPAAGTVTQEFGCTGFSWEPPRGDCAHFHDGIDIAGASGSPIRAPAAGVVAFVGWGYGFDPAFMVVLGHAGGLESGYGHLIARAVVRNGQFVKKGQVIGYMGNTGYSTGTHLHWEVKRNGVPLNPRSLL